MMYTITGASYANPDHNAAVIQTAEAGGVVVSLEDTPDLWGQMLDWGEPIAFAKPSVAVPASVTNFQARAVMRQAIMPDGRSLFRAVNEDLAAVRTALTDREDSDPEKIQAEIAWQAWEQANEYLRNGPLVMSLAARYGFDAESTDELFRQASQVIA